jgi:hypothetical protein
MTDCTEPHPADAAHGRGGEGQKVMTKEALR